MRLDMKSGLMVTPVGGMNMLTVTESSITEDRGVRV